MFSEPICKTLAQTSHTKGSHAAAHWASRVQPVCQRKADLLAQSANPHSASYVRDL